MPLHRLLGHRESREGSCNGDEEKPFIVKNSFLDRALGFRCSFKRTNPDEKGVAIVGIGNSEKPDFLRYLASPRAPLDEVGTGSVHHIAMAVVDESV